ncbi:unnamed protein product [Oppiella nova]|uniref:Uncharacterized protein n=1 Tax=Oppiella nova TaxID=334625 RepID=A0A7R9LB74_9ACAR|nr:unnamed protein product [Oppiella nova]CAG2161786.1 unnamed protein product [Oppiella nova]
MYNEFFARIHTILPALHKTELSRILGKNKIITNRRLMGRKVNFKDIHEINANETYCLKCVELNHIILDHLRAIFSDHNGCGQVVGVDSLRHNRRVHYTKSLHIYHSQSFVDHCFAISG